jgi:hypothetical protein
MPEHLERRTLDKPAQELLEGLGRWLEQNGTYVPGVKNFEKCTTSEGLKREVSELWQKMIILFRQIEGTSEVSGNTCYCTNY